MKPTYSERAWVMAILAVTFKPSKAIPAPESGRKIMPETATPEDNDLAMAFPVGNLQYITRFSAFVSDEKIDLSDLTKTYALVVMPVSVQLSRRSFREASSVTLSLSYEDFPFDPGAVATATVFLYSGWMPKRGYFVDPTKTSSLPTLSDVVMMVEQKRENGGVIFSDNPPDPRVLAEAWDTTPAILNYYNALRDLNTSIQVPLRDLSLMFAGFADSVSADIQPDSRTVTIECRDIVGMMLDQQVGQEAFRKLLTDFRGQPIETVIQRVLQDAHAGRGLPVRGIGFSPGAIRIPEDEIKKAIGKNVRSRINKDMSYWDLIIDLCGLCGLSVNIEYLNDIKHLTRELLGLPTGWESFMAMPCLSIYTADVSSGAWAEPEVTLAELTKKYQGKEFYLLPGSSLPIVVPPNRSQYRWWDRTILVDIGTDFSGKTSNDIGQSNIPAVRAIGRDVDGLLVDGMWPADMRGMSVSRYNKKITGIGSKGTKYWDPKSWIELPVPGVRTPSECVSVAKAAYEEMTRGAISTTVSSGRCYLPVYSRDGQSGWVPINDIQAGRAVAVTWRPTPDVERKLLSDSEYPLADCSKLSLCSAQKEQNQVQLHLVRSIDYRWDSDGFEATIDLINSWGATADV